MQVLVIEEPYFGPKEKPWDENAKRELRDYHSFDRWDIEALRNGESVFKDGTAFYLEDADEEENVA